METITPVSADEYAAEIRTPALPADSDFGQTVASKLGYRRLSLAVEERTTKAAEIDNLLAIMREVEMPFYRPRDVAAYKAEMVARAERANKHGIYLMGGSLAALVASVGAMAAGPLSEIPGLTATLASLASAVIGAVWALRRNDHPIKGKWEGVDLIRYSDQVPIEALKKAMRLREQSEMLRFEVDVFGVENTPNPDSIMERIRRFRSDAVYMLDPLLYVRYGTARLCFAKWDEPRFSAPLTE